MVNLVVMPPQARMAEWQNGQMECLNGGMWEWLAKWWDGGIAG
jgi:hypothetical protein